MFRPGTPLAVLALVAALFVAAGCGDGSGDSKQLTPTELAAAQRSDRDIRLYCRSVAGWLAGKRGRPTLDEEARTIAAADRLIALAREKPEAPYNQIATMRDLVGDIAENLEGTNCSEVLIRRLNDGLATVPSS